MKFQFKKLNCELDSEALGWREVTAPLKILLDMEQTLKLEVYWPYLLLQWKELM